MFGFFSYVGKRKQEAEFREFLTVGQKFTHLGIQHVVVRINGDEVSIHRECRNHGIVTTKCAYRDIDFLRAVTNK